MVAVFAPESWGSRIGGRGRSRGLAWRSLPALTCSGFIERGWRERRSVHALTLQFLLSKDRS